MIKTEFVFEGNNVVAYARTADGISAEDLVIKFVDEEGNRIYPNFSEETKTHIEELAIEELTDAYFESGLEF